MFRMEHGRWIKWGDLRFVIMCEGGDGSFLGF